MSSSPTRRGKVMARTMQTGPTGEVGRVTNAGVLPWSAFSWVDQSEHVPELIWPNSVKTYTVMRTDSQVQGLYLGATLPIRRYRWMIDPNGAPDKTVRRVSEDFNLPVKGNESERPSLRMRDAFNWDNFLRHALYALAYGWYFFEIVGEIRNGEWRLSNLAERPPSTVSQVDVSDQGALVSIKQSVGINAPTLPSNRLLPFVWEREGGNWFGQSMFRSMYKHWLIKDRLYRVDAIKHDRTGLGLPTIEAPPGATREQIEQLNDLAQAIRVGDMSGLSMPNGAKLRLVGTEGSIPDTLASIREHNESMARSFLLMFMQLGQTKTGSRALGSEFIDFFMLAQESIALWFQDQMSIYLIEDSVDWNDGPEVPAPRITHDRNPDPELAVADFADLIDKGAITVDPELEAYIRARYNLPQKSQQPLAPSSVPAPPVLPAAAGNGDGAPPQLPAPPTSASAGNSRRRARVIAAGNSLLPLPTRTLRRQPYEQEVRAAVDYAAMDSDWSTARAALVATVRNGQSTQVQQLKEQIIAANGDLKKLANILADPVHAAEIQTRMVQMASTGASQAIAEAARQGKVMAMPDLANVFARLSNRAYAVDAVLARSLSEAGARKALSLTGTVKAPSEVADQVSTYLGGFSTSYLDDQLGGALQQAMNAGRATVISNGDPQSIYSSELLDSNTCELCVDVDGTEYADLDSAEIDYPTGGYMDCLGGPRCRGTLIAVYGEEQ